MACPKKLNYQCEVDLSKAVYFGGEHELPVVEMKIGKTVGYGLLDTGASRTLISEKIARLSGGRIKLMDGYDVSGINGLLSLSHEMETYIEVMGYIIGPIKVVVAVNVPTFENAKFDALIGVDVMRQLPNLFLDMNSRIVSIGRTNFDLGTNKELNKEGKGGNASHTKIERVFIEDYLFTESSQKVDADSSIIKETDSDQTIEAFEQRGNSDRSKTAANNLVRTGEELEDEKEKQLLCLMKTKIQSIKKCVQLTRGQRRAKARYTKKEVRLKAMGQINPEAGGSKSPVGAC